MSAAAGALSPSAQKSEKRPRTRPYRVAPGFPQHVLGALVVQPARQHEQVIGQPVDVADRCRVHRLRFREARHVALGPAGDGAGEMQVRGGGAAARQHEGIERRQFFVHAVDLVLQALDLRIDDAQAVLGRLRLPARTDRRRGRTGRSGCAPASRRRRPWCAAARCRWRHWPRRPCRKPRPADRAWARACRCRARSCPCRRPWCRSASAAPWSSARTGSSTKLAIARPWKITRMRISLLELLRLKSPPLPMPTTPTPRMTSVAAMKKPVRMMKNVAMAELYRLASGRAQR